MKYQLIFMDVEERTYKREILDKNGDVIGLGEDLVFNSPKEIIKFMRDNIDNRCFDYYIKVLE